MRTPLNLILVASTLLLVGNAALAADDDIGIKTYSPTKTKTASAHGKMQIPPPPKESLQSNMPVVPAPSAGRPESVRTAIDSASTTVGSGAFVSTNDRVQRFASYLELKPGMDSAPLTMHLSNQGFKWFRLLIANQVVATEKSLAGKVETDLDLTGVVQSGTSQIVIQAGGVPGSRIEWKVTTPAVAKIDKLDPDEVLVGEEVKIKGKNFSANPSRDEVYFNNKKGQVTRAKSTELVVKVPTDAEIGDNKVSVKVSGVESNKVKVKLRGIPELSGCNLQGVPPGQQLTIFGKNFSKDLSENQVFFGDTAASIVSGNQTQLTVVVPFIPYHMGHTPSDIRVQVGKIMSKNTTNVQVGPQMYTEPGIERGADIPSFNPANLPRSGY